MDIIIFEVATRKVAAFRVNSNNLKKGSFNETRIASDNSWVYYIFFELNISFAKIGFKRLN